MGSALAVTLRPQSLIRGELGGGRLVEAGGRDWQLPVEIRLFRRRDAEAAAAEAFWRVIEDRQR